MRFATLVALAVVVSSTPGLAAPAPYVLRRPNHDASHNAHPKRDTVTTDVDNIVDALVQNSTISANVGTAITKLVNDTLPEFEELLGYAANSTGANSTQATKRGATSEIVQAIEAAFDGLTLARKRDIITTALQDMLEEAGSLSGNFKRDSANDDTSVTQFDERAFKIPASVTTWLKNIGNVLSIGASGAAVAGAFDGSSNSTKREWNTAIDGIGLERPPADSSVTQFDERAFKIPASVTTWLKNIGNVLSIGAGGAAIAGAFDGGSNSTKREFAGVDLTTLLDGVTPQFEDRSVSSGEVSGLESLLGKLAGAAGVGGAIASVVSAFEGSNNSTKRDLAISEMTQIISPDQLQQLSALLNATGMADLD